MAKTAVVALGGNALTREGQAGTYEELEANATVMAKSVCSLLRTGWRVVLVHGNGPQVGNLAIQQEEGARLVPAQPLFSLGAMTEGQLGSLICLALRRVGDAAWMRGAVALVTHVSVGPDDPAFDDPTKPIGPFLTPRRPRRWPPSRGLGGQARRRPGLPAGGAVAPARHHPGDGCHPGPARPGPGGGRRRRRGSAGRARRSRAGGASTRSSTRTTPPSSWPPSLAAEALVLVTGVEAVLLHYGTPRAGADPRDDRHRRRGLPGDGRVPRGEHGAEGARRHPVPAPRRRGRR